MSSYYEKAGLILTKEGSPCPRADEGCPGKLEYNGEDHGTLPGPFPYPNCRLYIAVDYQCSVCEMGDGEVWNETEVGSGIYFKT